MGVCSKTDVIGKFFKIKENFILEGFNKPEDHFCFEKQKCSFIGLLGNPVAATVTFLMLVVDYEKSSIDDLPIVERIYLVILI